MLIRARCDAVGGFEYIRINKRRNIKSTFSHNESLVLYGAIAAMLEGETRLVTRCLRSNFRMERGCRVSEPNEGFQEGVSERLIALRPKEDTEHAQSREREFSTCSLDVNL